MIFVTVGTQLGFDRLIRAVDEWCESRDELVFFQIGDGAYIPRSGEYKRVVDPEEYRLLFSKSEVVVSHAGMGGIITACLASKPIIILPRIASLGEHRNEHQLDTCNRFQDVEGCHVARDIEQLYSFLNIKKSLAVADAQGNSAAKEFSEALLERLELLMS